jgi:glycine cleavage system H protein
MANWKTPTELKYAKSDEWFRADGNIVTMGLTDYAQDQLSDIVYVELPEVGESLAAGDTIGVIESVKAASDVYTALSGEVIEVNTTLEGKPEQINSDPYGDGWLIKLRCADLSPLNGLMDSAAYAGYCSGRE